MTARTPLLLLLLFLLTSCARSALRTEQHTTLHTDSTHTARTLATATSSTHTHLATDALTDSFRERHYRQGDTVVFERVHHRYHHAQTFVGRDTVYLSQLRTDTLRHSTLHRDTAVRSRSPTRSLLSSLVGYGAIALVVILILVRLRHGNTS